jgi:uncharacterized protein (TIGR02147 family)
MGSIYQFTQYREYIHQRWSELPKKGYGQARKLAEHLGCHSTLISQILKGLKSFTSEQAVRVGDFFDLNEDETEYFLLLVNLDRAGTQSLRKTILKRIHQIQAHSTELVNRLKKTKNLTEDQKAVFYSDWSFSGIRQCTAILGLQEIESIGAHLGLPRQHILKVMDFLLETGLCKKVGSHFTVGPSSTHLESSSPWVKTHHNNWRLKAMVSMSKDSPSKLHYTSPMTLAAKDALVIREHIAQLLERIDKIVEPSPSEELHCLNIDWFQI